MYRILFLSKLFWIVSSYGMLTNFIFFQSFTLIFVKKKKYYWSKLYTNFNAHSVLLTNRQKSSMILGFNIFFILKHLLTMSHFCGWINFNILELIIKNKIPACFLAGGYNFEFFNYFFLHFYLYSWLSLSLATNKISLLSLCSTN